MTGEILRLGLVGIGKIACDQHIPALRASPDFAIIATASHHNSLPGVPAFADVTSMIKSNHRLDAVSICTPPVGRYAVARAAIEAGLHVMLEKPPGATVSEVIDLAERAKDAGVSFFTTWHSREAAGVDFAKKWLHGSSINAVRIFWREDIRVWHPGQDWILEAGGLGVFDPGINALSIATAILPERLRIAMSELRIPENRAAPISAKLTLVHGEQLPVAVELDFLKTGPQSWDIHVETDRGNLLLSDGGNQLHIDGARVLLGPNEEYARLYRRFAELISTGGNDIDVRPQMLVADAFLIGRVTFVESFNF